MGKDGALPAATVARQLFSASPVFPLQHHYGDTGMLGTYGLLNDISLYLIKSQAHTAFDLVSPEIIRADSLSHQGRELRCGTSASVGTEYLSFKPPELQRYLPAVAAIKSSATLID